MEKSMHINVCIPVTITHVKDTEKQKKINAVVDMTIIIIVVSGSFLGKIFRSY